MSSHPFERHVDTGGETPPSCQCIPEMSICCTQIIDQGNDQATGGIIGVTEDPSALIRWMIAGLEVSQLLAQYEIASEAKETVVHTNHHEQTPNAQQVFLERSDKLFQVFFLLIWAILSRIKRGPTLVAHKRHCPSQCS